MKIEISRPLRVVIESIWNGLRMGSKAHVAIAHVAIPIRGKIVIESAIVESIFPIKW